MADSLLKYREGKRKRVKTRKRKYSLFRGIFYKSPTGYSKRDLKIGIDQLR